VIDFIKNSDVFVGIVISVLLIIVLTIVNVFFRRYLKNAAEKFLLETTTVNFLKNAASSIIFLIIVVIIFYTVPSLRSLGLTLFASAGIFAAIIGFASQHAFSNIVSGIFIVIFKPFRVGDIISIGINTAGAVEDITLRHTVIRNFENKRIIIPNSIISSETIINSNIVDEKICLHLEIGISYDSDIDKAIEIMQAETGAHHLLIDNRSEEDKTEGKPVVMVRLIRLDEYSVVLRAYAWANNPGDAFVMKCDLLKSIKSKFDENEIEIPFPYRTIVLKGKKNENNVDNITA